MAPDPSIDAAQAFEIQLDALIDRWSGAVPPGPLSSERPDMTPSMPTAMTRPL